MVTTCFYGIHLTFSLLIFEQKVVRLLKSEVKSHSCRETGQSGQVPLILLDKPKALIPTNDVSEKKSCSFLLSNRKQVQTLTKVSNKIQLIKRLRQKLSFFWLKKIYLLKKLKKLKSCLSGTQTKKIYRSCQVCKKVYFGTTIFYLF